MVFILLMKFMFSILFVLFSIIYWMVFNLSFLWLIRLIICLGVFIIICIFCFRLWICCLMDWLLYIFKINRWCLWEKFFIVFVICWVNFWVGVKIKVCKFFFGLMWFIKGRVKVVVFFVLVWDWVSMFWLFKSRGMVLVWIWVGVLKLMLVKSW